MMNIEKIKSSKPFIYFLSKKEIFWVMLPTY